MPSHSASSLFLSKSGTAPHDAPKAERTAALQSALLAHGAEPAMIMVILALMGASGTVGIRRCRQDVFGRVLLAPSVQAVFDKYRPLFQGCLDEEAPPETGLRLRYWQADCQTKAFHALCSLKLCEMHELFAAFVASSLTCTAGHRAAADDTPLAAALALEIGAGPAEG